MYNMSKHNISWKIDRLGALIELENPIVINANDWSQLATNNDADLEIPFNDSDPSKPIVILTVLDGKKYVIGYFSEKNTINIHLDYDDPSISNTLEVMQEMNFFYDSVVRLVENKIPESILDIKIGIEFIDHVESSENMLEKLNSDFSYFSGIDNDIDEISLKLKKKIECSDGRYIKKVIGFSNEERLKIMLDGDIESAFTSNVIAANIEVEMDSMFNDERISSIKSDIDILRNFLGEIVYKDFYYGTDDEE